MDGGGVSTRSDDGALISPTTQQSSDVGGGGSSGAQQPAPHTLWRKRGVRLLSYAIGLDGPVERDVGLLLVQYALWTSCMLALNKAAVGSLSNPTVLLVVQLTFACAAVPVMQVATPVSLRVARVLPATLPTPFAERLGLQQQQQQKGGGGGGGGAGAGAGASGGGDAHHHQHNHRQPVRYFPGITASLHWLVTGIGFLLSIWCSIATLKHGDVSWYLVLHQLIPVGVCLVDWRFLGHDPPTPLAFGGVAFCLAWALGVMAWRTGSVVPEAEAGAWGLAWLATMTCYLPMLKRTCMLHKATPLERVFYSNVSALAVLCLVGVFYYTTRAKDRGGEMGVVGGSEGGGWASGGMLGVAGADAGGGGRSLGSGGLVGALRADGGGLHGRTVRGGGTSGQGAVTPNGGVGLQGGFTTTTSATTLRSGFAGVEWMAWLYVLSSSVTGIALSHVKMELLTHITATSYASFGVTALFPVRVWQSFSRVG